VGSEIKLGWDGRCQMHPTQPAVARTTQFTADVEFVGNPRHSIGRVLEIHCATGHQYLALDRRQLIEDPFSVEEEARMHMEGTE
jgi:hypothetical protein